MPEPRSGRRRFLRRRAVATAVAAGCSTVLLAALTSCGASGAAGHHITLTFTWWGNDDRQARTEKAVRLFEKAHPDVTVQMSNADFGSYKQRLATQAAGGGIPDLAQLDYRQISQFATGGALLPLDSYVKDGTVHTGEMDPSLVHTGHLAGKQYALPMGRGITGYVYDATVFAQAGIPAPQPSWTWQDYAEVDAKIAAMKLKSPDGRTVAGSNDGGSNEDVFEDWLRSHGKQLYAGPTKLGYTEQDLAAFWSFCHRLQKSGALVSAKDSAQADATGISAFSRGLDALDYSWDATFTGFTSPTGHTMRYAPVPGVDGKAGAYFKPTMLIGIGAHSKHPQMAAELMDFLLNDRQAGDVLGVTRSQPPNRAIAAEVDRKLSGPDLKVWQFDEQMQKYGVQPPPAAPPKGDVAIESAFVREYQRVEFGLASPAKAAHELVVQAKQELES
ncbi:ABC transporter substrate-binding protein [Streptomyces sp. NBC_00669]|uniref:ABC transporter substrate-binding protein n=1 Tax=Streptomyces sp. NBC_00669 TaxID=2976011 RepID=UPI002E37EFC4|nr:ABC transporter substrate-binding protein [Streptomyces sp. NBC_00669]